MAYMFSFGFLYFLQFWQSVERRYVMTGVLYLSPFSQSPGPHFQKALVIMSRNTKWMNLKLRLTRLRIFFSLVDNFVNLLGTLSSWRFSSYYTYIYIYKYCIYICVCVLLISTFSPAGLIVMPFPYGFLHDSDRVLKRHNTESQRNVAHYAALVRTPGTHPQHPKPNLDF